MAAKPQVGKIWTFKYPAHDHIGVHLEWVKRRVRVAEVKDCGLVCECVDAFIKNPFRRIGDEIVWGTDLDTGAFGYWYTDVAQNITLPMLRLGIVTNEDTLGGWILHPYKQTMDDIPQLVSLAKEWRERLQGANVFLRIMRSSDIGDYWAGYDFRNNYAGQLGGVS